MRSVDTVYADIRTKNGEKLGTLEVKAFGISSFISKMYMAKLSNEAMRMTLDGEVIPPGEDKELPALAFPEALKAIYNPPATIVLWSDGTKTVVKCEEDEYYDPVFGLALCFMKKALGNDGKRFNDELCTWGYEKMEVLGC